MNKVLETEEIISEMESLIAENLLKAPVNLEENILNILMIKKLEREN
jgi:hypothetical protein